MAYVEIKHKGGIVGFYTSNACYPGIKRESSPIFEDNVDSPITGPIPIKDSEQPREAGNTALRHLLNNPAMQPQTKRAIKELIGHHYRQCPDPRKPPRNCFETALYSAGVDMRAIEKARTGGDALDDNAPLELLLQKSGFSKVKEFIPFFILPVGGVRGPEERYWPKEFIDGVNTKAIPSDLKPGDVLFFGGKIHNSKSNYYEHAAQYLGEYKGKHYIFEKPSNECGAKSPYHAITLESKLELARYRFTKCESGTCYDTIAVFRKTQ